MSGWIGVDLDGTLAEYHGIWNGGKIGVPIKAMQMRVLAWLNAGKDVRIVTARVGLTGGYSVESNRTADVDFALGQRAAIEAWCAEHLGRVIPVTASKDFRMIELWDDRAVQVEMNTGRRMDGKE